MEYNKIEKKEQRITKAKKTHVKRSMKGERKEVKTKRRETEDKINV